ITPKLLGAEGRAPLKYPAIRSPGQREGYKGVFQDQLAEYTELLGEVRAARRGRGGPEGPGGQWPQHVTSRTVGPSVAPSGRQDWAFLEKQQRCEYLKKKLTHIKARIQDYDRDTRDSTGRF
uniref:OCEL domain-containing protein n=1 Tax=Strix occidentalis caurina TaxID=311401 RepID=A0A8D0KYI5_STROC